MPHGQADACRQNAAHELKHLLDVHQNRTRKFEALIPWIDRIIKEEDATAEEAMYELLTGYRWTKY
jgi:hypothetical protein